MAIIKCPDCKKEMSDTACICPNCGYPYEKNLALYYQAIGLKDSCQSYNAWLGLAEVFNSVSGIQDAPEQENACHQKAEEYKRQERQRTEERAEQLRLEKIEQENTAKMKREFFKKNKKRIRMAILLIGIILIAVFGVIPSMLYSKANNLLDSGQPEKAAKIYSDIGFFRDSSERKLDAKAQAEIANRYHIVIACGDSNRNGVIAAKADGTVVATGDNEYQQYNISNWSNIVEVDVGEGYTVGLKSDGTVVAAGDNSYGQCDVSAWKHVVAVCADDSVYPNTIGLKVDGTVITTGVNEAGQSGVSSWTDIVKIAAGNRFTVGLKSDGTVLATGFNEFGQCDVYSWTDIIDIAVCGNNTVGLKSDGSIVQTGRDTYELDNFQNVTDIMHISIGDTYLAGIREDGTVIISSCYWNVDYGLSDISKWENISAITTGWGYAIGVKTDGSVIDAGEIYAELPKNKWTDVCVQ